MGNCTSSEVGIRWNEESLKCLGLGVFFRIPRQSNERDQIELRLANCVDSSI